MAVPVAKITDPLLDIVSRVYLAKQGAASVTHQQVQAVSYSDAQVRWSVYTPSVNIGVDRRFYVEQDFRVTLQPFAAGPDAGLLPTFAQVFSNDSGLRQLPLTSCLESVQLKLNNSTVSINLDDTIHALMRYGSSPQERNHYLSGTPSCPDEFPEFANAGGAFEISVAGGRNPFADYATKELEVTRNLRVWVTACVFDPITTRVTSFDVKVREPVFIPPLNWSERDVLCLFGIQTIDVTFSYSDLSKLLEGTFAVGANTFGTVVGTLPATPPRLHLFYVSPQINMAIPKLLHYPYYELGRYISSTGSTQVANPFPMLRGATPFVVPAGASGQVSVNNIQLQSIPKRIYVYLQEQKGAVNRTTPNVWARIDRISVNWNSVAGKLSTAESYDLYRMSVKNGLEMTWNQWSRFNGSVLCIEPPTDLGLSPLEASGSRGSYQLQFQVNFTNLQNRAVTYQVYSLVVAEGFMTINDSLVSQDVGVLTETAIADAPTMPAGTMAEVTNMYGGGFWGDLWKGIKKGAKFVTGVASKAAPIIGSIASAIPHPAAQAVGRIAPVVGQVASGVDQFLPGGALTGGARSGGRMRRGGAMMARRGLSARARM